MVARRWVERLSEGDGKEACERIGVNYQTAQNCGNDASKIKFSRRRENLTFSHHAEVCAIKEEAKQDRF